MKKAPRSHRSPDRSFRIAAPAAILLSAVILSALALPSCAKRDTVVVYTSVDQVYSEKIFNAYEKTTGVRVKAVYDIEATKTVGLVNRLISEKDNPRGDVFWNSEILQTISLKTNDVLEAADIANAADLPAAFVDEDNEWFGFGGRARVLIYNKKLISAADCPKTMADLATDDFIDKSGLSNPIFGTASTQAAVLYAFWGADRAKKYYQDLKNGGVVILDGNGVVKDYVDNKQLCYGMTDTDDAILAMSSNPDLGIIFLDQGADGMGTLVIPNTVAKIKGGPNPEQAEKFMEYLLSAEVEQMLVDDDWIQIPVHDGVTSSDVVEQADLRIMAADFNAAFDCIEKSKTDLTSIFVQ